jgi:hypothetical protein
MRSVGFLVQAWLPQPFWLWHKAQADAAFHPLCSLALPDYPSPYKSKPKINMNTPAQHQSKRFHLRRFISQLHASQ